MNKEYFKSLMDARRLSVRGLAQRMGMQHSQLSLTFSGRRKLQLDEAAQLSQIFGVPLHQIATNAGVPVRPATGRKATVIGFVNKTGSLTMNPPDVIERAEVPDDMPEDVVAAQFRTAESNLEFSDGWVAFFRRGETIEADAIGRMSFCKIANGPHAIATLRRGYQPGTYNLTGIFSQQNAVLESASPILMVRP